MLKETNVMDIKIEFPHISGTFIELNLFQSAGVTGKSSKKSEVVNWKWGVQSFCQKSYTHTPLFNKAAMNKYA